MGTTTEFDRIVTNCHHTDFFTVFFTEEGHSTHFLSCVNIGFNRYNWNGIPNLLIDFFFNTTKFFRSNCLKVRKVKAEEVLLVQGTSLCCMLADNIVKSCMEQVSCCVVLLNTLTAFCFDFKCVGLTN